MAIVATNRLVASSTWVVSKKSFVLLGWEDPSQFSFSYHLVLVVATFSATEVNLIQLINLPQALYCKPYYNILSNLIPLPLLSFLNYALLLDHNLHLGSIESIFSHTNCNAPTINSYKIILGVLLL